MRTYIALNDNGRRAKAVLAPILAQWQNVREMEFCMAELGDDAAVLADGFAEAQARLQQTMRRNERILARSFALSPAQVMILTLRYVRGLDWATIAQTAQMNRAQLYQERRIGLNGIDLKNERGIL